MGRSGTHRRSRTRHYRSYGGSSSSLPLWVYVLLIFIFIFINIQSDNARRDKIKDKDTLQVSIEIMDYLYDDADYFKDDSEKELIKGLTYFYEKTGVQPVIYTKKGSSAESEAKELYLELFNDEAHLLIVVPVDMFGGNSTRYYYMGDDTETIVTEDIVNYLLDYVDASWSSKTTAWSNAFRETADLMLSN